MYKRAARLAGGGQAAGPEFRQFATMGQPGILEGLGIAAVTPPAPTETDKNTKEIEKNTGNIDKSVIENRAAMFQVSSDIQKAVRESKPRDTGRFFGFVRRVPT